MSIPKFILLTAGGFMLLACFSINQAWAQRGETTRISIASNGKQGDASSSGTKMSADGRWVAFFFLCQQSGGRGY